MADILKVLVADGEPGIRDSVTEALADYSLTFNQQNDYVTFRVDAAATGLACLETCQADPRPDILILDDQLPGPRGLPILTQVSSLRPAIPIIVLSGKPFMESAVTAMRHGASDYLGKPIGREELRRAVGGVGQKILLERQARKNVKRLDFVSIAAHELKAPLAAIEGYLQIVLDKAAGENPEMYRQMLERSLVRARGMRSIIRDLLDLARIENKLTRRELVDLDIVEAARHAVETCLPEAESRDITVHLTANGEVRMQADRADLDMILNNLLSNAVKYNVDHGRVEIAVARPGEAVVLSVTDTGIGMTPDEAGRLFKEFVRIKNEKTLDIPGSGLGLSILRKLVDHYQGRIDVSSQPGKGTTFVVTLPGSPTIVGPEKT